MKALISILFLISSLNAYAALQLDKLTISTPNIKLAEQKRQTVSLSELKNVLEQLSNTGTQRAIVRSLVVEGTINNPPARGMAPVNQTTRVTLKSNELDLNKAVVLKPDVYNKIEVPLSKNISKDIDISELLLETESLGLVGDLKVSFIIEY